MGLTWVWCRFLTSGLWPTAGPAPNAPKATINPERETQGLDRMRGRRSFHYEDGGEVHEAQPSSTHAFKSSSMIPLLFLTSFPPSSRPALMERCFGDCPIFFRFSVVLGPPAASATHTSLLVPGHLQLPRHTRVFPCFWINRSFRSTRVSACFWTVRRFRDACVSRTSGPRQPGP